jgi:hypothetical protein
MEGTRAWEARPPSDPALPQCEDDQKSPAGVVVEVIQSGGGSVATLGIWFGQLVPETTTEHFR